MLTSIEMKAVMRKFGATKDTWPGDFDNVLLRSLFANCRLDEGQDAGTNSKRIGTGLCCTPRLSVTSALLVLKVAPPEEVFQTCRRRRQAARVLDPCLHIDRGLIMLLTANWTEFMIRRGKRWFSAERTKNCQYPLKSFGRSEMSFACVFMSETAACSFP